jgi:transcriptional regulator with XRE-family HTH domain
MSIPNAHWETRVYRTAGLGQILADERFRFLMLQRSVAARSGVRQSSISAYERGRATPTWDVFVKILAAMDRRAVIRTEPLDPGPVAIGPSATANVSR